MTSDFGFSHKDKETGRKKAIAVVLDFIKAQKKTLWVEAYEFTHPAIIQAVLVAKQTGVDVRIVQDYLTAKEHPQTASIMAANNIPFRQAAENFHIMHCKVMIGDLLEDGGNIELGSFNYSVNAETHNAEVAHASYGLDLQYYNQIVAEFNLLWEEGTDFKGVLNA